MIELSFSLRTWLIVLGCPSLRLVPSSPPARISHSRTVLSRHPFRTTLVLCQSTARTSVPMSLLVIFSKPWCPPETHPVWFSVTKIVPDDEPRAKSLRVALGQAEQAQKVVKPQFWSWVDPSWSNSGIVSLDSGKGPRLVYGNNVSGETRRSIWMFAPLGALGTTVLWARQLCVILCILSTPTSLRQ